MTMGNTLSNCMERIVVFSGVAFVWSYFPQPAPVTQAWPARAEFYWCSNAIGCEITG